jgi:hypothetical protein
MEERGRETEGGRDVIRWAADALHAREGGGRVGEAHLMTSTLSLSLARSHLYSRGFLWVGGGGGVASHVHRRCNVWQDSCDHNRSDAHLHDQGMSTTIIKRYIHYNCYHHSPHHQHHNHNCYHYRQYYQHHYHNHNHYIRLHNRRTTGIIAGSYSKSHKQASLKQCTQAKTQDKPPIGIPASIQAHARPAYLLVIG